MKKVLFISVALIIPLLTLTACSKASLTSTGTPPNGGPTGNSGTPPDGGTPPEDGGTPPSGAPDGGSAPIGEPTGE